MKHTYLDIFSSDRDENSIQIKHFWKTSVIDLIMHTWAVQSFVIKPSSM